MYIVRSFYQMADGEWITSKSGALSKADAEFLKDRLYFHFNGLHDDGKIGISNKGGFQMYIVKIMYLTKGWEVHKDKTPPVSKEAALQIAQLQTRYLLKMTELNIIDDYMVEIIAE